MQQTYNFKPLEIGGKVVKFKIETDPEYIYSMQQIVDGYPQMCMKEEHDAILHNTDLVYNFLLENNIPRMDMIKPIAPAFSSSSDINAEILENCEKAMQKLYALDYINEIDFIDVWKDITKQWYDSKMYIAGYRCEDMMQVSLSGIHYVAPGALDIRRNMIRAFEQPFDSRVLAGIVTMYMIEYICPFSVMNGVMARMALQYYLRMPGVQIWKELYMNSHEYRSVFLSCVKPDEDGVIDITEYFEYIYDTIETAYDRYCAKGTPLTEEENSAYEVLLKKAESSSYVMPIHLAVVALRLRYEYGIDMLNTLNMRGRIEFTDSNNIVVYKRGD